MLHQIKLNQLTERYFFADLAGGRTQQLKRARARAAIVGVAPYYLPSNNRRLVFVVHAWAARVSTPFLMEEILRLGTLWKPKIFGIESNAMQTLFADLVVNEAQKRKLKLSLAGVDQPTSIDKDWRIRTALQQDIASNNLYLLQEQHTELVTEIGGFPTAMTKDIIDALASIFYHLLPKTSAKKKESDEAEALAEYLRQTGAPPDEINRRLLEIRT